MTRAKALDFDTDQFRCISPATRGRSLIDSIQKRRADCTQKKRRVAPPLSIFCPKSQAINGRPLPFGFKEGAHFINRLGPFWQDRIERWPHMHHVVPHLDADIHASGLGAFCQFG